MVKGRFKRLVNRITHAHTRAPRVLCTCIIYNTIRKGRKTVCTTVQFEFGQKLAVACTAKVSLLLFHSDI